MNRSQSPLWAPLFCKMCSRRASIIVANVLMCGECFFKHTVAEFSRGANGRVIDDERDEATTIV